MVLYLQLFPMKYLCLIIFLFFIQLNLYDCKLRFVFTIYRHGARSPMSHGTDVLGEKWDTYSQLTKVGIRQQYLLGVKNRKKYNDFLSLQYEPKEVCVFSTNWNRTILSATANLQGLFSSVPSQMTSEAIKNALPPGDNSVLEKEIFELGTSSLPFGMQIIPVGIIPEKDRLKTFYDTCPTSKKILAKNIDNEEIQDMVSSFNEKYGKILVQLLKIEDEDFFLNFRNIVQLCDVFVSDYTDGREISLLRDAGIDFNEFNETAFKFFIADNFDYFAGNTEINKAYSSSLLKTILENIQSRVDLDSNNELVYNSSNPKMIIYSLHDYDITSLIVTIQDMFSLEQIRFYPSYSSSLTFELHNDDNIFTVKAYFNDNTFFEIGYEQFNQIISSKAYSKKQYNILCQIDDGSINYFAFFTFVFGIIAVLEFFFIYRKLRRSKTKRYVGTQNLI